MTRRLCIFGEVLFDHFPDGQRVLGGAPFNVAWHLQAFGEAPYFVSRVGDDEDGEAVRRAMVDWGLDTGGLQSDPVLPTGRVEVSFDDGEPTYDIVAPCAWDRIEAAPAPPWHLLYHGSLALREPVSRAALEALTAASDGCVFVDVNLRPPWWQRDAVLDLLEAAAWVKLNQHELDQLGAAHEAPGNPARRFVDAHRLEGLILTRGEVGAEVWTSAEEPLRVAPRRVADSGRPDTDPVGAGDAFASVILLGLARDWPLALALGLAQDFASAIVGRSGATVSDRAVYRPFIEHWQLDHDERD